MGYATIRLQRAFTLIEMLVVIVIAGIIVTLAAPSFREMFRVQRLRSINAQLVTDLQFARSEAVSRNEIVYVNLKDGAGLTCYSIFTARDGTNLSCDCSSTPACAVSAFLTEVRTVRIPADTEVSVRKGALMFDEFGFDPITQGLWQAPNDSERPSVPTYTIDAVINGSLSLSTRINLSGRPTVCAPAGSKMQVPPCS